jgi:anti-sigma factor RsiW
MAEEFVFGRLAAPDAESYEAHLLTCETCQYAVEEALNFIKALRRAVEPEG